MTHKFGSPSIPAGAPPSGYNLIQLGSVALGAPGSDLVDIAGGINAQRMIAEGYLFNTVTAQWERTRTGPIVRGIRTQAINAAMTVWTPAAGKRFRLMGYRMTMSGNAALAAAVMCDFQFNDNGTAIPGNDSVFVPAAAAGNGYLWNTGWVWLPGNGFLSAAANNVLNLFASGAGGLLTAGFFNAMVAGTEE